jgi:hypothetical protein
MSLVVAEFLNPNLSGCGNPKDGLELIAQETPMEIDPEELKKFVKMWFAQLRRVEAELLAQASALDALVQGAPAFDKQRFLDAARKNPKIAEVLDKKYGAFEREVIDSIDKGSLDQDLYRSLRDWKPEGPTN